MIYFDANYVVRLYFEESGFDAVRQLASRDTVACSVYGRAEVIAAFHRKFREGAISENLFAAAQEQFSEECRDGAYRWLPLSPDVMRRVESCYAALPRAFFLRAGDAIHLATAVENRLREIYSNDQRLLAAASQFGLKGVNIIRSNT